MKFLSFYLDGETRLGVVTANGIVDVKKTSELVHADVPLDIKSVLAGGRDALDRIAHVVAVATEHLSLDEVSYAPAIPCPNKVLCVGTNYRRHALESNLPIPDAPVYFSKYANSLAGHCALVAIPSLTEQCDYEVELAVVIGRQAKHVSPEDALDNVFGYSVGNDLSARDLQFRSSQWLFGKAIDGFSPLGPYVVTADEVPDPQSLTLKCWVNGELRQHSNTTDMIFSVAEIISDLSQVMTLEPGDVIYTGTPEGVALGMAEKKWLQSGDEVICEIEGLGQLVTRMVKES